MSTKKENKTVKKRKTCLACGRLLTGRQRKWCSRSDCGGRASLHPFITVECVRCGRSYEREKGYHEDNICRSCSDWKLLEHPSESNYRWIQEIIADYVQESRAEDHIKKAMMHQYDEVKETDEEYIEAGITVYFVGSKNPNFCDNCGQFTSHREYGVCLDCRKKNPTAISVSYCENCKNDTLHDPKGICLKCDQMNPTFELYGGVSRYEDAFRVWEEKEERYRRMTGEKVPKEAGWYYKFECKTMYELAEKGHSRKDIASEFDVSKSVINGRVKAYCKANDLESPWQR